VKANAIVKDSHLWSRAAVHEGATVSNAIVCCDAVVKRNARISRGCILSDGVIIGESVTLPEFTRVSRQKGVGETSHCDPFDSSLVGSDGEGYVWKYEGLGDYDDETSESEGFDEWTHEIDPLKAASIGNTDEEDWKRLRWV